jgi:hypothetical protein
MHRQYRQLHDSKTPRLVCLLAISLFTLNCLARPSCAALVLTANDLSSLNLTFSDASPTVDITIKVSETDFNSGGVELATFGFQLQILDPTIASISAVTLSDLASLSSSTATTSGDNAIVSGTYNTGSRPDHYNAPVSLAVFTITGLSSGSTGLRLLERTVGDDDFQNFAGSSALVPKDGTLFDTFAAGSSGIRFDSDTAINFSGTLNAVPEPSSLVLLVVGCSLAAGFRGRREELS